MEVPIEQGDKVTLVTKTAVLICEVLVVRPRPQGEDTTDAADQANSSATLDLGIDAKIDTDPGP